MRRVLFFDYLDVSARANLALASPALLAFYIAKRKELRLIQYHNNSNNSEPQSKGAPNLSATVVVARPLYYWEEREYLKACGGHDDLNVLAWIIESDLFPLGTSIDPFFEGAFTSGNFGLLSKYFFTEQATAALKASFPKVFSLFSGMCEKNIWTVPSYNLPFAFGKFASETAQKDLLESLLPFISRHQPLPAEILTYSIRSQNKEFISWLFKTYLNHIHSNAVTGEMYTHRPLEKLPFIIDLCNEILSLKDDATIMEYYELVRAEFRKNPLKCSESAFRVDFESMSVKKFSVYQTLLKAKEFHMTHAPYISAIYYYNIDSMKYIYDRLSQPDGKVYWPLSDKEFAMGLQMSLRASRDPHKIEKAVDVFEFLSSRFHYRMVPTILYAAYSLCDNLGKSLLGRHPYHPRVFDFAVEHRMSHVYRDAYAATRFLPYLHATPYIISANEALSAMRKVEGNKALSELSLHFDSEKGFEIRSTHWLKKFMEIEVIKELVGNFSGALSLSFLLLCDRYSLIIAIFIVILQLEAALPKGSRIRVAMVLIRLFFGLFSTFGDTNEKAYSILIGVGPQPQFTFFSQVTFSDHPSATIRSSLFFLRMKILEALETHFPKEVFKMKLFPHLLMTYPSVEVSSLSISLVVVPS